MLNLATEYDAIKYTALLTEGTFTEYELGIFATARTNHTFSPEIIHATVENMANANMIRLLDTIPCDLYIVNDSDMWDEEATQFFKNHAREFGNCNGSSQEAPPARAKNNAPIPEAATVIQDVVAPTPPEKKEAVKAERELSYAERMSKNSYFNRMKEESKKKKKKK